MNDTPSATSAREVVGLFAERETFEAAITALQKSGFEHSDLSLLSSHESLEAAGEPGKPWRDVLTALVGELKFEAPLVASGAIFLAGGPMAATVAGLIGAATGVIAAKEVIEGVTSSPHTEDFARSLEAGSVILWVRAETRDREDLATQILNDNSASNVHIHEAE
ncbi:MAG: hypothetical protein H8E36_03740 [Rhodospirillaceae bacterium]|nr:hypothetical protein [Rhodospirillaceae bacterium]MBL6941184.1 hypothetical protein [Rhodospirillales bacterium]